MLWRAYSGVYDGLLAFWPYRHLLSLVQQHADLAPGARLLDLGCGTGNFLVLATRSTDDLRVLGVDGSAGMLGRARAKLAATPGTTLVLGDVVEHLRSCADASVDRVVSINVLYALPDRPAFWREVLRVLAPGGRAVVTTSTTGGSGPMLREHLAHEPWHRLLRPRLLAVAVIDALISVLGSNEVFAFPTEEVLSGVISDAGGTIEQRMRCYGGEEHGVNVLFVVTRRQAEIA